ncbi:MAG: bifunctional 2-C-methyl-D-erythritol 4-phosphate cytidylyltransferase/2-C-methyl-D-erythritol 2,4-cyclodiphosphate synthase, partial [Alphaproteobacteria bacterium]|nr:bifunctional 2-C-methyl-D-erythritol 4-phosphate cytidylyltransferase/2-C-methyl-D-erythritol 2,4-cyclodiphosphate synthase [Alphaproteobacteria bacterium]
AVFASCTEISDIRVVIHPDDRILYNQAAQGLELLEPVFGGATRQASVCMGLESLKELNPDTVLIHDGARPFVDTGIINRVLSSLDSNSGAIPAIPLNDTIKRSKNMRITETIDRSNLWRAQTPQGFKYKDIMKAHETVKDMQLTDDATIAEFAGLTDDSSVAEFAGLNVVLVKGSRKNIKITSYEDILHASKSSDITETRTGNGFDVHAFEAGDSVMLCGVSVPHDKGLAGHSDADVALHAVTDALLGAIGAGDIGNHFPPSDERWKNVSSCRFASHAVSLIKAMGGRIINVDVTIICQAPHIAEHKSAMKAKLAEILETEHDRVSIKATTTEGLGFTGRKEGIATQATVSIAI